MNNRKDLKSFAPTAKISRASLTSPDALMPVGLTMEMFQLSSAYGILEAEIGNKHLVSPELVYSIKSTKGCPSKNEQLDLKMTSKK